MLSREMTSRGVRCIHEWLEDQAARTPEAVALVCGQERLTYEQLNRRANQLARHLRNLGTSLETPVALCTERTPEMVIGMLAIMKAGGFYVPLDPAYPQERLAFMLDDMRVPFLVTVTERAERIPDLFAGTVIDVRQEREQLSRESQANMSCRTVPENLAYVIYTSGSTGRPKGVGIQHGSVDVLLRWAGDNYSHEETAAVLASTSMCFDLSVFEIFLPLSRGGRIVLVRNVLEVGELPENEGVTLINTVPSGIRELCRTKSIPKSVSVVNLAGEVLHGALVRELYQQENIRHVINLYGPSEDTTYSTCACLRRESDLSRVPIGRPISETQLHVLDENMEPVGSGASGELYIGGKGLARGYLRRPGLTATRFIPNQFGGKGERLYRTGDLVRWGVDGNLEFLGRIDHQIKIRGYRIELGEIEARLLEHPRVEEAVAVAREDGSGERHVVAYFIAKKGVTAPTTSELREYLGLFLPQYMVPAAFVLLEKMPLNPNHKVDCAKLPAPIWNGPRDECSAPSTSQEKLLCRLWSQVLRQESVGVHDNFFELGGHSLLATRLISVIREEFQTELPLRSLFESPTVAGLAAQIENLRLKQRAMLPAIRSTERKSVIPLSFAQQRLWFIHQLEPESAVHNVAFCLRIEGKLDKVALKKSFHAIVRHHEALRTIFPSRDGIAVQEIMPDINLEMSEVDLRSVPDQVREEQAKRTMRAAALLPFDLACGPLLRVQWLCLKEQEHLLAIVMHHIITDDWSMDVLESELGTLYRAYCVNHPVSLQQLEIQYSDYAVWHRNWLQGEILERQLHYWRKELADCLPLHLPADLPRPERSNHCGATARVQLSRELTRRVQEFGHAYDATTFMVLLAGFQELLARYSGQDDIAVGTAISSRRWRWVENLIGFFVNTMVLRSNANGNQTFLSLLRQVKDKTLHAYDHQDVPFERIVQELQPERDLSRNMLFQAMFVFEDRSFAEVNIPGLVIRREPFDPGTSMFDLSLSMKLEDQQLSGFMQYDTQLFTEATMRRFVDHYIRLVDAAVSNPHMPVGDICFLSDQEKRQIYLDWNRTEVEYRENKCVHTLFEEQAAANPAAVAISCEGQSLSYGELNVQANQLAYHLRTLGVRPEITVGVCLERSLNMVVAILAVLKAGGAYVPVDPEYPTVKLKHILEDSQANVLICSGNLADGLADSARMRKVNLDLEGGKLKLHPRHDLDPAARLENTAYVIYTSGSTGLPKGAAVPHSALTNHMLWMQQTFHLTSQDSVLQKTAFSFDASVWEFYAPLLNGGRLVMARPGGHVDGAYLVSTLREEQVTLLQLVPSMLELLMQREDFWECNSLRYLFCGGEALPEKPAHEFAKRMRIPLVNLYGPTEATIDSTYWTLRPASDEAISIGRPIANARAYLLDERWQPVPVGVVGELYIAGAGLARGYWNRPALTAERFVPDSFSVVPGGRLYRTGDLARWRADGNLEFLGRLDHQVKLRGFRIEPGEIEAALRDQPGIRDAVVLVQEEEASKSKRLVAYIASHASPDTATLRRSLLEKLPSYMVPSAYTALEKFPLTPNGKVDRKSLPKIAGPAAKKSAPPASAVEIALAEIWKAVLKKEQLGIHDNFFELGGHSLLATQVISRIPGALAVELPLRALFEAPTIAELAVKVENTKKVGSGFEFASGLQKQPGIGEILASLESLSEAEVQALLDMQNSER